MDLRARSDDLAAGFPPLLAAAYRLSGSFALGAHGRRRAGAGEEFWQYRPAFAQDGLRSIDWRRSGKSDDHFVRQQEWQTAQSVALWVDRARSMAFASGEETKAERASVLALALSLLLNKSGERFGLMDAERPVSSGTTQITRMATRLTQASENEYGVPPVYSYGVGTRAVFLSDFLGDWDALVQSMARAADAGVQGCLVQILDPAEAAFPYEGRLIFESMAGRTKFESLQAKSLKDAYLDRLKTRQSDLKLLANRTGWTYFMHQTDQPAEAALTWLFQALERR